MQVVIDIPEEAYNSIELSGREWLIWVIKNSKPLPKGHWTHDGSHWENRWICSECGFKLFDEQRNYCPNCGAKMLDDKHVISDKESE